MLFSGGPAPTSTAVALKFHPMSQELKILGCFGRERKPIQRGFVEVNDFSAPDADQVVVGC